MPKGTYESCSGQGIRLELNQEQRTDRKARCPDCGKLLKIRVGVDKEAGKAYATVPRHSNAKEEATA